MQLPRASEVDACAAIGSPQKTSASEHPVRLGSFGQHRDSTGRDRLDWPDGLVWVHHGRAKWTGRQHPTGPRCGASHASQIPILGENGGFEWFVHSGEVGVAMVCVVGLDPQRFIPLGCCLFRPMS